VAVAVLEATAGGRWERRAAVLLVAGIAAVWAGALALTLAGHGGGAQPHHHHHGSAPTGAGFLALATMWSAMMVFMMVPPELPALTARIRPRETPVARSAAFFLGLLAAWIAFSAVAALGHWALERHGLVDAAGVLESPTAAAALLGLIGAFQLTPLKRRCLDHCRAELEAHPPARGVGGAFLAGLRHGTVGMGSCALIMLLPFAHGGMSAAPMVAVTLLLVVEKLARRGLLVGRMVGAAFVAWSAASLAGLG
jgi:predicted metal-binding membrane protein